jgi:hypothetical protein
VREVLELARQRAIGLLHDELVDRFRNQCLQPVELLAVQRLLDVVVRALTHGLHGRIDRRLAGDDDALGVDFALLHLLQQRKAIELRHLEIGEDDPVGVVGQPFQRLLAIDGDIDGVPLVGKDRAQPIGDRTLIVGDQYLGLLFGGHSVSALPRVRAGKSNVRPDGSD